jgi:polyisoprenoid-binding protein YceI
MNRFFVHVTCVFLFASTTLFAGRYTLAADESSLEVHVPRAGLLKVLGHDHTIDVARFDGVLVWDSDSPEEAHLHLSVPAAALSVIDEGVSEDTRAKIQTEMRGEQVLHVETHPEIAFESMEISIGESGKWDIKGALTVRGVTRPVQFPADVSFPSGGRMEASGMVQVTPEVFGIEPVRALGGAVRTASTIEIRFNVIGVKEAD